MVVYSWFRQPVPDRMPVNQVYGWIFDEYGRVVIWRVAGHFGLPGGRPEPTDTDQVATLRREVFEEVTAEITDPHYLGYQRVEEDHGCPPYAQVRMIARLGAVHPAAPDPDSGRLRTRLVVAPARAAVLLDWGEHGHQQAQAAVESAGQRWGLPVPADQPPERFSADGRTASP
ncbi:MAG TPA: NUDIX hydrolase [Pseudonocardiaceae bacterium]|jgi:8-oxo-dGTP pyrophosphatase MutT (NUDIX family)|nr:NUDIX hydrolase [Pseudonocardiaceae bacterium]